MLKNPTSVNSTRPSGPTVAEGAFQMLVTLGVDAKQLAIFSHRAQEGNERSRVQCARDSEQQRG